MRLGYMDALAGSGKTYALVERAMQACREGKSVLFVQPTIELSEATKRQLEERFGEQSSGKAFIINGKTQLGRRKGPVANLTQWLKIPPSDPHVLFVTWSAFEAVPFIPNRDHWTVIVDEVPEVLSWFEIDSEECALLESAEASASDTQRFKKVQASSGKEVRRLRKLREKFLVGTVLEHVRDKRRRLYSDIDLKTPGSSKNANVLSVLMPDILDGFGSVIVASALFKESLLFKIWERCGVEFEDDVELTSKLRYSVHPNGKQVEIRFAIKDEYSKSLRDRFDLIPKLEQACLNEFGEEEFLYLINKDKEGEVFRDVSNAIRLPQSAHGLNHFQHVDNVAILSARNPPSAFIGALEDVFGINSEEIRTAIHRSSVYQAVMRSRIRSVA